jgi:hypothetical protein
MDTKQKLEEVRDILDALLSNPRCSKTLLRAHDLVVSAISDFFDSEDDTAIIPLWFEDESVGELNPEPPFPAA